MKTTTTSATALASAANVHALVKEAFDAVGASFERFCLMAGIESLTQMLGEDVDTLAGGRYEHRPDKPGYRWGQAKAQVGFHGGKIEVDRPRVRNKATGKEMTLPSWEEIAAGGFLDQWAVNLMVMNVATRQFGRAVRLPEARVPAQVGSGCQRRRKKGPPRRRKKGPLGGCELVPVVHGRDLWAHGVKRGHGGRFTRRLGLDAGGFD